MIPRLLRSAAMDPNTIYAEKQAYEGEQMADLGAVQSGLEKLNELLAMNEDRLKRLNLRIEPVLRAADVPPQPNTVNAVRMEASKVATLVGDLCERAGRIGWSIDALADRVDL